MHTIGEMGLMCTHAHRINFLNERFKKTGTSCIKLVMQLLQVLQETLYFYNFPKQLAGMLLEQSLWEILRHSPKESFPLPTYLLRFTFNF